MTRELLGAADVSDEQLSAMVAQLLHEPGVELLEVRVDPVQYDLPAITTAARWWVSGQATTSAGVTPFRIFVKQVQNWCRSPLFAMVPAEMRETAAASVPWRTEAAVYRSDLATRLPAGLSMPRALAVVDIDELSSAVWLEVVPANPWPWDANRYACAAHLLGRLAGNRRVAELAQIDDHQWTMYDYLHGRFEHQVVPMLFDDQLWLHPLISGAYSPELRDRMRAATGRAADWVEELVAAPHAAGHGDACPNNLLGTERQDEFVLIDFGFWKPLPVGFDLGQLLLGEVQLGRAPAAGLADVDRRIVPAFRDGLAAEGCEMDPAKLTRVHALQMTMFSGLSSLPFEHLGSPLTPELRRVAADRAAITAYCLDLVEATEVR